MMNSKKLRFLYAAVSDCLPTRSLHGKQVRLVKVGSTDCFCDREEAFNRGALTEENFKRVQRPDWDGKLTAKGRTIPLLGCHRWHFIAVTDRVIPSHGAKKREDLIGSSLGDKWQPEELKTKIRDAAKAPKRALRGTNGYKNEIYIVDLDKDRPHSPVLVKPENEFIQYVTKALRADSRIAPHQTCANACPSKIARKIPRQTIDCSSVLQHYPDWVSNAACNQIEEIQ